MSRHEPAPDAKRLLGRLHARLHADDVADLVLQALIEFDQKIDGVARSRAKSNARTLPGSGPAGSGVDKGRKVLVQFGRKFERPGFGVRFDEEIERIDHLHVGDQIDVDGKLLRLFGKHVARKPIAVRILLPVDEVLRRLHCSE